MLKTSIFYLLILSLIYPSHFYACASLILMTKLECVVDKNICANNICRLTTIRRNIKFIDFACNIERKLDNILFKVQVYRKSGSNYQRLLDVSEDYCKVLSREGTSIVLSRILPRIKKYGNLFSPCPLKGNYSVSKYPIDFSFMPSPFVPGHYKIVASLHSKNASQRQLMQVQIYVEA